MYTGNNIKSDIPDDGRAKKDETGKVGTSGKNPDNRNSENTAEGRGTETGRITKEEKLPRLADVTPVTPKQGKPKKKEEIKEAPEQTGVTKIFVGGTISAIFAILENRFGNKWRISQAEIDSLSEPSSRLIDRHMKLGSDTGDGIQLIIAVLLVFGSRMIPDKGEKKNDKERKDINIDKPNDKGNASSGINPHSPKSILKSIQ